MFKFLIATLLFWPVLHTAEAEREKSCDLDHVRARGVVIGAIREYTDGDPHEGIIQVVQAVAWTESQYGCGWKDAGKRSHNWGAVTCGRRKHCRWFSHRDSHPVKGAYVTRFRVYPSERAGVTDLAREILRRDLVVDAFDRHSVAAVSAALYDTRYYWGEGPTREARIANHTRRMRSAIVRMGYGREWFDDVPQNSASAPGR